MYSTAHIEWPWKSLDTSLGKNSNVITSVKFGNYNHTTDLTAILACSLPVKYYGVITIENCFILPIRFRQSIGSITFFREDHGWPKNVYNVSLDRQTYLCCSMVSHLFMFTHSPLLFFCILFGFLGFIFFHCTFYSFILVIILLFFLYVQFFPYLFQGILFFSVLNIKIEIEYEKMIPPYIVTVYCD